MKDNLISQNAFLLLIFPRRLSVDRKSPYFGFKIPWVPEVFLACGGNFRCWPKADTSSAVGRSHERAGYYKDLTETGNRARKVSGTQGSFKKKRRTEKEKNVKITCNPYLHFNFYPDIVDR